MALLRKLFWVALFIVFTFGFVVLFDNGPTNYVANFKAEFQEAKKLIKWEPKKKGDQSDKIGK